ncbi:MAG: outer membrane beta-barrel protein [Adhaeribacter sp.]
MLYSHRFARPGRSVTLRLRNGLHRNTDDNYRLANNIFYNRADSLETLKQFTRLDRQGLSWEGEVSYTEPVGSKGQLELEYEVGNMANDSDKRTYDFAEQTNEYSLLNIPLSNTFTNSYLKQEAEAGYRYNTEKLRVQVEGAYQQASLKNEQEFPRAYPLNRDFHSVLPSTRLEYRFSKSRNLQLQYRTSTDAPSAGQLQEVIDYSNPLMVRTGNAGLRQSYQHTTRLHYRDHQAETNRSFFAMVGSVFTNNFISNSTFIAPDSMTLPEGISLGRGAQLIRPVNLAGYRNVWTYFSYGQPWQALSSNINVNGTASHSIRPGLINDQLSESTSSHFRLGLSLSSNISERIDFTLSTNSAYNIVKNSLRPTLNNNYFTQSTRLRYNWIFWKGLVYRTDLAHQVYAGLSPVGNNFLLWNMSLGKKVFKNQRGELNVNAYDLLKQNTSIWRNVSDAYVEDTRTNVLQRYFMLTFTYNIRYFGVGSSEKDFQDKNKG